MYCTRFGNTYTKIGTDIHDSSFKTQKPISIRPTFRRIGRISFVSTI